MARLLSNMVLRGIPSSSNNTRNLETELPTNGFASSGTHPTRITSDPDTHKDFQSTNKSTGISVLDIVQQDVQNNPVMIYMKGLPDAPRCGFSALAVKVSLSGQEIFWEI